eukprot:TRINITY_DN17818_c0_g1_i5.p3 TRINITY_DN17818_c0_g1~~TRINITY_DN17818_c0_g1_i5.p3  ORF type:complete len:155 (-),score=26.91 TRINITY_DN17818_c0_g1_i5:323-787(-)
MVREEAKSRTQIPTRKHNAVNGSAIFLVDFDANICDYYRFLAGKTPAWVRIPWPVMAVVVFVMELLARIVFWGTGVRIQHPVTGITTETLVACSVLTARGDTARRKLGYLEPGDDWVARGEAERRTRAHWQCGRDAMAHVANDLSEQADGAPTI